jgi:hypothetical protein
MRMVLLKQGLGGQRVKILAVDIQHFVLPCQDPADPRCPVTGVESELWHALALCL